MSTALVPLALLLLASAGSWGCSDLWGTSTKPDSANCVRNPDACAAGQICNTFPS